MKRLIIKAASILLLMTLIIAGCSSDEVLESKQISNEQNPEKNIEQKDSEEENISEEDKEMKEVINETENAVIVEDETVNKPYKIKFSKMIKEDYNLNAISYNGTVYVTVGTKGIIFFSEDGVNWEAINSGTSNSFNDVIWFKDQFVAVGNKGLEMTSSDGLNWGKIDSHIDSDIKRIASNDVVLAALSQNAVYYSEDGLIWDIAKGISKDTLNFEDIYYENGQFIIMGKDNNYNKFLFKSTNGIDWENIDVDQYKRWVGHGNGKFVTLSQSFSIPMVDIFISEDGLNWSKSIIKNVEDKIGFFYEGFEIMKMTPTENGYVAVGEAGGPNSIPFLLISDDGGKTWDIESSDTIFMNYVRDLMWDGNKYISVGVTGTIRNSVDGINWIKVSQNMGVISNLIQVQDNGYILTNDTSVYYFDGINKTEETSVDTFILKVFNIGEEYLILTYTGPYDCNQWLVGGIYKSTNKSNWLSYEIDTDIEYFTHSDIIWDGQRYILLGRYEINDGDKWESKYPLLESDDGVHYKTFITLDKSFNKIKYINNKYFLYGDKGYLGILDKNLTINIVNLKLDEKVNDIFWNGRSYLAVGETGMVASSEDGLEWTVEQLDKDYNLLGIIWDGEKYLVYGVTKVSKGLYGYVYYSENDYNTQIYVSEDGKDWSLVDELDFLLNKIIWDGNQYVGAGSKFVKFTIDN